MHRIFIQIAVLVLFCVLIGCGPLTVPETDAQRQLTSVVLPRNSPYPTIENLPLWVSGWDGEGWIVTIENPKNPDAETLRSQLIDNLIPQAWDDALRADWAIRLRDHFRMEWFSLPSSTQPSAISAGESMAIISIPSHPFFLKQVLGSSANSLQARARWQYLALSHLPGVTVVEPNLMSDIMEVAPENQPPEMRAGVAIGNILKKLRADVAYQHAGLTFNDDGSIASQGSVQSTIYIAVIDTGVDYQHPELANRVKNPLETPNCLDDDGNGYIDDIYGIDSSIDAALWNASFTGANCAQATQPMPGAADSVSPGVECPESDDPKVRNRCGHGTHVAGIIAANGGPTANSGALGICPVCNIIAIRASSTVDGIDKKTKLPTKLNTGIMDHAQIRALNYVLNLRYNTNDGHSGPVVSVVNMSIGRYYNSRHINRLIHALVDADILVVAAAGNADTDSPNYPAAYDPVLAVCATGNDYDLLDTGKAEFSNFGSWVDICAPGFNIPSLHPGNLYRSFPGTSQASPMVAGAAGFLASLFYNQKSMAQIGDLLIDYANFNAIYNHSFNNLYRGDFPDGTQYYLLGGGFLDLGAAATLGQNCGDSVCPSPAARSRTISKQISGGCVVSSVAQPFTVGGFLSSLPGLAILTTLMAFLIRKVSRH